MTKWIIVGAGIVAVVSYLATRDGGASATAPVATSTGSSSPDGSAHAMSPRSVRTPSIPAIAAHGALVDAEPATRPSPAGGMIIPPDLRTPPLREGEVRFTSAPDEPPAIEGAIGVHELMMDYAGLVNWIETGAGPTIVTLSGCKDAFLARGGVLAAQYSWSVALHFVADGKVARVTEVLSHPEHWPDVFDAEAKECWIRVFSSIRFASDKVVDAIVEYPIILNPPRKTGE